MASGCCKCHIVSIFKSLFHIFNLLNLVCGLTIFGLGIWNILTRSHYIQLHGTYIYPMIIYLSLSTGVAISLASLIGYFGVWREHQCTVLCVISVMTSNHVLMLLLVLYIAPSMNLCVVLLHIGDIRFMTFENYTFLLLVIFFAEISVGLMTMIYHDRVDKELQYSLNNTFLTKYGTQSKYTNSIDYVQKKDHCCGAVRYDDWEYSYWYLNIVNSTVRVPDSCCLSPSLNCGRRTHPSNIHHTGCIRPLLKEAQYHLYTIELAVFSMSCLQVVGVVLSFVLCIKIKNVYY